MKARWRALGRNVSLAAAAVVCAVVLWAHLDSFVEDERVLQVLLRSQEGGAPVASVNGRADCAVSVTVRGPSRVVRRLDPGCIRFVGSPGALRESGAGLAPSDFVLALTGEATVTRVELRRQAAAADATEGPASGN